MGTKLIAHLRKHRKHAVRMGTSPHMAQGTRHISANNRFRLKVKTSKLSAEHALINLLHSLCVCVFVRVCVCECVCMRLFEIVSPVHRCAAVLAQLRQSTLLASLFGLPKQLLKNKLLTRIFGSPQHGEDYNTQEASSDNIIDKSTAAV